MKIKLLSILSVSALLIASCSKNENMSPDGNDGRVKFSSGVNQSSSRIVGDTWDGNEKIGIYMVASGQTTVVEAAENAHYKANGAGSSTSFTPMAESDIMYYPVDESRKVDFIAYHPYTVVKDYIYDVKTVNQSSQSDIDLMRGFANNGTKGYDKTNKNAVNLEFHHKLTNIVLNIHNGEGIELDDLKNLEITFKGMDSEATYDIANDKLTLGEVVADIKAHTTADAKGKTYELTIVPQSVEDNVASIEFKLNNAPKNEVFTYKFPKRTFEGGKKHTYRVTIKRNEVVVQGTIKPWDEEGEEIIIVD